MNQRNLFCIILFLALPLVAKAQFIDGEENTGFGVSEPEPISLISTERPELVEEVFVLQGRVSGFDFIQPETNIFLETENASWQIVGPSAVELRRLGWTSDALFIGEMIEIEAVRLLGSGNIARLSRVTRANGSLLLSRIGSEESSQSFDEVSGGLYSLDNDQAHLYFSFDHLGFSQTSVKAERLTGSVLWDSQSPESSIIQIEVDASSLRSGITELDDALRGPAFFDFLNHPKIRFNSTAISFSKWGGMQISGQIEILGLIRPVTLEAKLIKAAISELTQNMTVGVSLEGEISRSLWGLTDYLPMIGDSINLQFQGEFVLTSPEQSQPEGILLLNPGTLSQPQLQSQPTESQPENTTQRFSNPFLQSE